jgi:predicted amidophosphoribosyltransferase
MPKTDSLKWLDEYCHACGKQLNSWDVRCSKALGYEHRTCEQCIAAEYDKEPEELRGELEIVFGMRPCMGI